MPLKLKRKTTADWGSENPTLADGEPAFDLDLLSLKIGPGVYNSLPYVGRPMSAFILTLLDDADAATARGTFGLGSASVATVGTGAGQLPTTADVDARIANVIDSSPAALDTLNELAAALGDDANFAASMTTALAGKAATSHTHAQADVTGLVVDLAAKCSGTDPRLSDARTPTAHTHAQADVTNLAADLAGKQATLVSGTNIKTINGSTVLGGGDLVVSGAAPTLTAFTKDLGAAKRSGTFDITGLSGLTADKAVTVVQTAAAISSKGNARDEAEMDLITVTGYVVNGTTIRCFWNAPSVVVGTYAFGYTVSA